MLRNRTVLILVITVVGLFALLRLPGVNLPYHLDEYSWPKWAFSSSINNAVPHPPLGKLIFGQFGRLVGTDHFRLIPLCFSLLNLLLLFYLAKIIFGFRAAIWTSLLFAVSFYSVLASLMVDTDGAIMPFFFLLTAIAYIKLRGQRFVYRGQLSWWLLLFVGVIGGFLVKVSFIIPLIALALDLALTNKVFHNSTKLLKYCLAVVAALVGLFLSLLLAARLFPSFDIGLSLKYWLHFVNLVGRNWFQTFIQFAKSFMYLSPLLVVPLIWLDREIIRKTRPFLFFIVFGLIFYLVIFDFSIGALDRYLQYLIIPLCLICGVVIAKMLSGTNVIAETKGVIFAILFLGVAVFATQFFSHSVPPLYPKADWLHRLFSLQWGFLFPFTGGSGPAGFYISFVFIAFLWFGAIGLAILSRLGVYFPRSALVGVLMLGFLYNVVFTEEYLFGLINGSLPTLVVGATKFINQDDKIKEVVSYNGIGGHELQEKGKFRRRFYAAPQFEAANSKFLSNFTGDVLYVDIPRIQEGSFYFNYLRSCTAIYQQSDKYITAQVLDCKHKT